ncbi:hypothetical protein SLT36_30235 (plasmid) [Aminobacter sp. BA135]|uniref:hypothetical protein n=1 Tax=Aminobacter sp. BA135 TaxID=537596 RepID=UPI003D7B2CA0
MMISRRMRSGSQRRVDVVEFIQLAAIFSFDASDALKMLMDIAEQTEEQCFKLDWPMIRSKQSRVSGPGCLLRAFMADHAAPELAKLSVLESRRA